MIDVDVDVDVDVDPNVHNLTIELFLLRFNR